MLDEGNGEIAGVKCENRLRRSQPDLGQFGRKVLLRHRRQHFLDDVALVVALHATKDFATALEVRRMKVEVLHAKLLDVFTHRCGNIAVLERGREEILVTEFASQFARTADRGDHDDLGLHDRLIDGENSVGQRRPDQDIDLVLLDKLGGGLQRDVGLGLIVLLDDLDWITAELAAIRLDFKVDRIADRLADDAEGTGKARQQADLDGARLLRGRRTTGTDRQRNNRSHFIHRQAPFELMTFAVSAAICRSVSNVAGSQGDCAIG